MAWATMVKHIFYTDDNLSKSALHPSELIKMILWRHLTFHLPSQCLTALPFSLKRNIYFIHASANLNSEETNK